MGDGWVVRPYSDVDAFAWDRLIDGSRSAHFFFKRGYLAYHADRFADASLMVSSGERLVAAFPASRDGQTVVSHGGLTFGGIVSDERLTTRRTVEVLGAICRAYAEAGVTRLIYKAVPHIYHRVAAQEDLYALFVLGGRLRRRDVSTSIDLSVRPRYSKGRRAAVASGRRTGVTVAEEKAYGDFMALEAEVLRRRHGVDPVHSADELERLHAQFPENIRLFTARLDGNLLAGMVIYETPLVAHAQYMGASTVGHAAHALDVVVDEVLNHYDGAKRWFDFGISTEQDGRWLNEGLVRNKESFGGRAVVYDHYELNLDTAAMARQSKV